MASGAPVDRDLRRSRGAVVAVVALLLLLTGAGLWQVAAQPPPGPQERAERLAAGLACPTCEGQSVAQSRSEMALQMQAVVAEQVAAGRSDEEVRRWFVDRYGDGVLLVPPARGAGLVLWAVPVLTLAAGAVLLARLRGSPWPRTALLVGAALAVCVPLVLSGRAAPPDDGPAGPGLAPVLQRAAEAEEAGDRDAALAGYQQALALAPGDSAVATRVAFLLLSTGEPERAESVAADVVDRHGGTAAPDALLVLGLAQRALQRPAAEETLQGFLDAAPEHPAAEQVRELLVDGAT